MKKITAITLLTIILLSIFTACDTKPDKKPSQSSSSPQDSEPDSTSDEDNQDDKVPEKTDPILDIENIDKFSHINLNDLNFNKQKVKSNIKELNLDINGWYEPKSVSGDIIYIESSGDQINDPYLTQYSAVSMETGEILAFLLSSEGTVDIKDQNVAVYNYAYDVGEPIEVTLYTSLFEKIKNIEINFGTSNQSDADSVTINADFNTSMIIQYIEKGNSIVYLDTFTQRIFVINADTLEINEFEFPEIPIGSMVEIYETNSQNIIMMSLLYYDDETAVQCTLNLLYDISKGEVLDKYLSDDESQSKNDLMGLFPQYGVFYSFDKISDTSIDDYSSILYPNTNFGAQICGKGTFGTDSVTEIAVFDPINSTYKTTIPDEPNAFPVLLISENELIVTYITRGKIKFGIMEYSNTVDDFPPDKLDFSQNSLDKLIGKTVPLISSDQNWGTNLKNPTNYSVISDIAVTFAYAASAVRTFDSDYEVAENKNIDDIMTQFVLELISVGRYEKGLSEYAVPVEDADFNDYFADYDEIDSIVKSIFPDSSGAVKFEETENGRIGHSTYSSEQDNYIISPRSWSYSGNYTGDFDNNNVVINKASFDESTEILTIDFDFYLHLFLDYDNPQNAVIKAKVDTDTGKFEILDIKY